MVTQIANALPYGYEVVAGGGFPDPENTTLMASQMVSLRSWPDNMKDVTFGSSTQNRFIYIVILHITEHDLELNFTLGKERNRQSTYRMET